MEAPEKQQITHWLRQVPEIQEPTDPSIKSSRIVHPIQSCLREFTKGLPRVDDTGLPFYPDRKVQKKDRVCLSKKKLDELPPNPHYVPEPRERAARHKPLNMFWDEPSMKKARDEFYVPAGMRVLMLCPEIYDRPLLRTDDKFRTRGGGLMTPCPKCKCNNFVSVVRYTSVQEKCQRVLNEANKQDVVIGAVHGCKYYDMCDEANSCAKKDRSGNINPKHFTVYTKETWNQYPDAVKTRYLDCINIEDDETSLMLSPGFSDKLLFYPKNFDALEKEMSGAKECQGLLLTSSHQRFVAEQKSMLPSQPRTMTNTQCELHKIMRWPAFKGLLVLDEYFKSPSSNTLIKMFELLFEAVVHHLLRYLFNTCGGQFLRVDGTHNIMKKTMNLKEAEKENNCLVKLLGEYGHILLYAFCEAEDRQVVERLVYFLRLRYERLGGMALVRKVIAGYSDTCCGNGDPHKHCLPLLFPGCKRAWLKDVWHGCDTVSRTTHGHSHDLHDSFMKELWSSMIKQERRSLYDAVEHFQKHDEDGKNIKDTQAAIEEMMKKKDYRGRVYNYISRKDIKSTVSRLKTLKEATKAMDEERRESCRSEGTSYQRYFRKTIPAQDIVGTEDAIDNLISHVEKGCFVDPLAPRSMSYPATGNAPKNAGPPKLKRRRGTNVVEINNKHSNIYVLGNASRQRSSLTDKKLLLYVVEHNLTCDKRIQHITNKKPLPRHWFTLEALQKKMEINTRTTYDDELEYPPELDLELHREPIGELYQLYEEWDKQDAALRELHRKAKQDLSGIASYLVPTGGDGGEPPIEEDSDQMPPLEAGDSPQTTQQPTELPAVAQLPPLHMDQAAFSARAQAFRAEQSPARKKTKPTTNMFGAERYGPRKSSGDTRPVNKQYIHQLNQTQKTKLDYFYSEAMKQHNYLLGTDALCERIATMFNEGHTHWLNEVPGGCGGLVNAKLVKQHLKERGNQVVRQQLQHRMNEDRPAVAAAGVYHPPQGMEHLGVKTVQEIERMNRDECRELCRSLGKSPRGNKPVLLHRIKEEYGML